MTMKLLTRDEVAELINRPRSAVAWLQRKGELEAIRLTPRDVRTTPEGLDRYLQKRKQESQ